MVKFVINVYCHLVVTLHSTSVKKLMGMSNIVHLQTRLVTKRKMANKNIISSERVLKILFIDSCFCNHPNCNEGKKYYYDHHYHHDYKLYYNVKTVSYDMLIGGQRITKPVQRTILVNILKFENPVLSILKIPQIEIPLSHSSFCYNSTNLF